MPPYTPFPRLDKPLCQWHSGGDNRKGTAGMAEIDIYELPAFKKRVAKILTKDEKKELRKYLSFNPDKGDVIRDTGGARKLRWAADGKGKQGGARIIYLYHVVGTQVYLIDCYKKSDQDDINNETRKKLKEFSTLIKKGK